MNPINSSDFAARYLENLIQGNRQICSDIVQEYLAQNASILDLYEQVIKVSLYEVGRLWETNQISVAIEHLSTAITEGILNELFERIISKKKLNRKVVVACMENEHHQVGAKMVADTFEMHGWESFFPGTGLSVPALISYIQEKKPDLIAVSLSIYFNAAGLLNLLETLRNNFPAIQILVGGQALSYLDKETAGKIEKVVMLPDLYLLESFITSNAMD
jgi:methanogenic corrinoid protein MtbC1